MKHGAQSAEMKEEEAIINLGMKIIGMRHHRSAYQQRHGSNGGMAKAAISS